MSATYKRGILKMAKSIELKVTIILDEEVLRETFEDYEVRPSKAKLIKLINLVSEYEADAQEVMEDALKEFLGNIITDEWER